MSVNVTINPQHVSVSVPSPGGGIAIGTPTARDYVERDPYTGDYAVTPSGETQTLNTNGLRMTDNVTVNPIPSNYGLITWNGAVLTVS